MSDDQSSGKTQLLSDDPVDEDAFEGGHDRVAEALANLIRDEEGGKAIALRGPYGSGKSTVVKILEDKIEDDGETRIFTYDAWEHQGDPLRRSFIESLVEFLRDPEYEWAKRNAWGDAIERIARRKETTEIETEPVLTTWGRVIAVFIFLAPLGAFVVNNFISGPQGNVQWGAPEVYWWMGGALLFLLPILGVLGALVTGHDPFYVFVRESSHEEETKTIRTPDPTTIEFQDIFHKILWCTLHDNDRQLILVVDNLDRLPAEDAFSTWATMRTFFERRNGDAQDWEDRFWLVVPFNFEALRSIFEEGAGTEGHPTERPEDKEPEETEEHEKEDRTGNASNTRETSKRTSADDLQAFIDKTFTTTYRVAPPVLSDWEQFMKDKLRDAFPDYEGNGEEHQGDFHTIYRLYRIAGTGPEGIPTPRDIILFINHLSTLYRQWGNQKQLPVLAAYALLADEISRDGHELKDSSFLDQQDPRIGDELNIDNWQEEFAALHFNVEEGALQVLIGEPVREALETGDAESLQEEADVIGFPSVLDDVVTDVVRGGNASTSAKAGFALRDIEIEDGAAKRNVWGDLLRGIKREDEWHPASEEEGDGVVGILQHSPGSLSENTVEELLKSFSETESLRDATSWTDGVSRVIRHVQQSGYGDLLRETLHVPGDGENFIEAIAHLESFDDRKDLAPFFVPKVDPQTIDEGLNQIIERNDMAPAYAEAVHLMTFVGTNRNGINWSWEKTVEALSQRITNRGSASEEELKGLLKTALIIARLHGDQTAKDFLSNNAGRGHVLHYFHQYRNGDDLEIAALCVFLSLFHNPGVDRGNNPGNANQGKNELNSALNNPENHDALIQQVSRIARELRIVRDMVGSASSADNFQAFIKRVLQDISQEDGAQHITADLLCDHSDIVVDALHGKELDTLVEVHLSSNELIERLREIDQEEWEQVLNTEGRLLDLVLCTLEVDSSVQLPSKFSDALYKHAQNVLAGNRSPTRLRDGWHRLSNALSDSEREAFLRRIQRSLLNSTDSGIAQLVSLYEEPLFRSGIISSTDIDDPDTLVNDHFVNILDRGNETELKWLKEVVDTHPELEKEIPDNIWNAFKRRVTEKLQEQEGEPQRNLKKIAEIIEIDLSEEEEPEDSKEDQ